MGAEEDVGWDCVTGETIGFNGWLDCLWGGERQGTGSRSSKGPGTWSGQLPNLASTAWFIFRYLQTSLLLTPGWTK
jgi:hypothetical protein